MKERIMDMLLSEDPEMFMLGMKVLFAQPKKWAYNNVRSIRIRYRFRGCAFITNGKMSYFLGNGRFYYVALWFLKSKLFEGIPVNNIDKI